MFLFHIAIYVLFAYIMYVYAAKSNIYFPNSQRIDKYLWGFIIFFTIICAIRGNVGVDTLSYVHIFKYGDMREDINGEYLFAALANFMSKYSIHFSIGLGICAFIQIYYTVKGLLECKWLLLYVPLVLFGSSFFLGLVNGMRQMMVACIFIYASRFIVEKKLIRYVVFVLVCSLIHHSAFMLLPFYLLGYVPGFLGRLNSKRMLMLTIFIVCFVAGMTPQFQGVISHVENMANFIGYDSYADRTAELLSGDYTSERRAFGPMQISYFLLAAFTIWFGPHLRNRYVSQMKYFDLWFFFNFFYVASYFLVCNTSHIFIRPIQYFQMFHMIVCALLVFDLIKQGRYNRNMKICAYAFILIIWVSTSWDIVKNYRHPYETVTYKTFFIKK